MQRSEADPGRKGQWDKKLSTIADGEENKQHGNHTSSRHGKKNGLKLFQCCGTALLVSVAAQRQILFPSADEINNFDTHSGVFYLT